MSTHHKHKHEHENVLINALSMDPNFMAQGCIFVCLFLLACLSVPLLLDISNNNLNKDIENALPVVQVKKDRWFIDWKDSKISWEACTLIKCQKIKHKGKHNCIGPDLSTVHVNDIKQTTK